MSGLKNPNNQPVPEESPEFWTEVTGKFMTLTDEIVGLRGQKVEQIFNENGLDYADALEGFYTGEEEQVSGLSQSYSYLIDELMHAESDVATRTTKVNPSKSHIWITKPGGFVQSTEVEEDGQTVVEFAAVSADSDGIYQTTLKTPKGE